MTPAPSLRWSAFDGDRRIAADAPWIVADRARSLLAAKPNAALIVFDDATGRLADLRGGETGDMLRARLETPAAATSEDEASPARRGRPRLGVTPREVTLLPRHWDWLADQPGGASAALRRLVETASRDNAGADRARRARDAAYSFLSVMAGDAAGYEEALRALYAGEAERFAEIARAWPGDVGTHALSLAAAWFAGEAKAA